MQYNNQSYLSYGEERLKDIAWMVSHCKTDSKREGIGTFFLNISLNFATNGPYFMSNDALPPNIYHIPSLLDLDIISLKNY